MNKWNLICITPVLPIASYFKMWSEKLKHTIIYDPRRNPSIQNELEFKANLVDQTS